MFISSNKLKLLVQQIKILLMIKRLIKIGSVQKFFFLKNLLFKFRKIYNTINKNSINKIIQK